MVVFINLLATVVQLKGNGNILGNKNAAHVALMITLPLLTGGNIHPNPGPAVPEDTSEKKFIEICHVNMRSLNPNNRSSKLDELHTTFCIKKQFDIICVSETWLDNSISDKDIELPDYQIFRKYRNRHEEELLFMFMILYL